MSSATNKIVSTAVVQGVKKITPQTAFSELRTHLSRATVNFNYAFADYSEAEQKLREEEPTRIDSKEPYHSMVFEETETPADNSSEALQDYSSNFCRDGELWIQSDEVPEAQQAKCLQAIQDWLILRRAAREEAHILKINNVGVERDEMEKVKNVAKHVGLAMPKQYNKQ